MEKKLAWSRTGANDSQIKIVPIIVPQMGIFVLFSIFLRPHFWRSKTLTNERLDALYIGTKQITAS
jgi:hypothetical protein